MTCNEKLLDVWCVHLAEKPALIYTQLVARRANIE